ncbi:hypothetical protein GWK47_003395 [Chionoecetes opilio]|uniref:Uncharacterized protein n=1 Tax=Chionoecetes opilio TaxID=41210 RepID=A0A8J4YLA3_CHIOP|nr:hypothetical protein GWK47_003395 [Chionoecetes opilio]
MKKRSLTRAKLKKTLHSPTLAKLHQKLEEIEMMLILSHEEERKREELQAIEHIKVNSKFFYAYAKKKLKKASSIGPLMKENGDFESEPGEIAKMLIHQYEDAFSPPNEAQKIDDPSSFFVVPQKPEHLLTSVTTTTEDIIAAIDKVAPHSAAGPDGFHAQLLKHYKHQLALPLKLLQE